MNLSLTGRAARVTFHRVEARHTNYEGRLFQERMTSIYPCNFQQAWAVNYGTNVVGSQNHQIGYLLMRRVLVKTRLVDTEYVFRGMNGEIWAEDSLSGAERTWQTQTHARTALRSLAASRPGLNFQSMIAGASGEFVIQEEP